jgi:hypothetical protein
MYFYEVFYCCFELEEEQYQLLKQLELHDVSEEHELTGVVLSFHFVLECAV